MRRPPDVASIAQLWADQFQHMETSVWTMRLMRALGLMTLGAAAMVAIDVLT